MKKLNLKSTLALMLALCLLLSGVGALAADPTVTVQNGSSADDVVVTVSGDVKGDYNNGNEIWTSYDEDTEEKDANVMVGDKDIDDQYAQKISAASSITVNEDNIDLTVTQAEYPIDDWQDDGNGDWVPVYDESHKEGWANGINVNANESSGKDVAVNAKSVSVSVDVSDPDDPTTANAQGVLVSNGTGSIEGSGSVTVHVTGNVSADAKAENTADASAVNIYSNAASGDSVAKVIVDGTLSATADGDEAYASGLTIQMDNGSVVEATTGAITAEGKEANGISIGFDYRAEGNSTVTVEGDVLANGSDVANGIDVTSIWGGESTITVNGDVTAKGKEAVGLDFWKDEESVLTVLIDGILSGDTIAIRSTGEQKYNGETWGSLDPLGANIYVWKAEEKNGKIAQVYDENHVMIANPEYDPDLKPSEEDSEFDSYYFKDGKVYTVEEVNQMAEEDENFIWNDWDACYYEPEIEDFEQMTTTVNDTASEKLEKAIMYIIKVASSWENSLKNVKGEDTYQGYDVAHEDYDVTFTADIDESKVGVDGVYYMDDGTTQVKAETGKWGQNGSNFWVRMIRGGGMMLGLITHEHKTATREENRVAATCTKEGSYDEVTYCTVCNKVLKTEKKTVAKLAHTPGSAVRENVVEAKVGVRGSYDEVVYCTVCGQELSRASVEVAALSEPEDKSDDDTDAAPATPMELVYDEVDELHGVKAEDHPEAAEALAAIGEALDGEDASVEIVDAEKLMDAEQKAVFDSLSVKDRLMVVLNVLGLGEALEGDMSPDAAALVESLTAGAEESAALLESFKADPVEVDGEMHDAVSIDLVIDREGKKSYERYTFYDDAGAWKLYSIEQGAYRAKQA